jgi:hypothetical protein
LIGLKFGWGEIENSQLKNNIVGGEGNAQVGGPIGAVY